MATQSGSSVNWENGNGTNGRKDGGRSSGDVRIWVDGCFDLFHWGHANAMRQARAMGTYLIAGAHTDEEIEENKGPTVLTLEERTALVEACRWADEVVPGAPYVTEIPFIKKYNVDYVVHGDDITTDASGLDTYRIVKSAGMYKECKRTLGVSTTDAIARVLGYGQENATAEADEDEEPLLDESLLRSFASESSLGKSEEESGALVGTYDRNQQPQSFDDLFSSRPPSSSSSSSSIQFAFVRRPRPDEKIVFVDGSFDLLSVEDLKVLREAHESGGFVVAGVWGAKDIKSATGSKQVLSLKERVFGALQCKYVSGVLAPFSPCPSSPSAPFLRSPVTTLPLRPPLSNPIAKRIEGMREGLEARQRRKLGKSLVEKKLKEESEGLGRV